MSTSAALSPQQKEVLTDAVLNKAADARKQVAKKEEASSTKMETNTFAKIIFNESLSASQKQQAITEALTFAGTKEENRERVREFEDFKEYLQDVRGKLAKRIIDLTDTEAFADLKLIYDQINQSLVDFDNKMSPLTDIIEAVYTLRTNGATLDTYKQIMADRDREKDFDNKRKAFEEQIADINKDIAGLNSTIDHESLNKSFFTRKIKPESQQKIALANASIEEKKAKLAGIRDDITKLNTENEEISHRVGQYDQEKAKLRELLDISTDEHRQRQQDLVAAAVKFVDTAKERIGSVRDHLGKMNEQVENLADTNSDMTQIYAILNEGIKSAEKDNQGIRDTLDPPKGKEESLIEKMTREEKLSNINSHIKMLDASAADTMMSYADLTTQTIRIQTMKDANDEQITKARALHAQGVAGVADRLSVVLQAVSSAAINESQGLAKNTLGIMADNTNRISQKEAIRVANGFGEQNQEIEKAMADLASYGEVSRTATDLTRAGVKEMREKLEQMQHAAEDVQKDIKASLSAHADVGRAELDEESGRESAASNAAKAHSGLNNPFNKL